MHDVIAAGAFSVAVKYAHKVLITLAKVLHGSAAGPLLCRIVIQVTSL